MKVFLATHNKGKIEEIKTILNQISEEIGQNIEVLIPEQKNKIEETGKTYEQNALIKACWWEEQIKNIPIISEDSGIEITALGGYPGKDSSVVPTPEASDRERCLHILELMKDKKNRNARYVSCALILFKKTWFYELGYTWGEITHSIIGDKGFGYDPIFFSPEINKTFGEATIEEKTSVSHRKRALMKLKGIIKKICQEYL